MPKSIFSVSQVNAYIKKLFANDFVINDLWIKGEVSNCKIHRSGHIYFTLKDMNSAISCVVFKNYRDYVECDLRDGIKITARGYVSVYERAGTYQVYVQQIKPDGIGDLYQRFEALKGELEKKGYFDASIKKAIPKYPRKVGIITSDTGAAIRDIMNVAKRRNPYIGLVLYPSLVQGDGAAPNIVQGIKYLDAMDEVDVIIVGRGGGSIEDLWAFNEKVVAKAIYEADTPIISAVGHETDFTISDFISDLRAPTPSAGAELAIPVLEELEALLSKYRDKLSQHFEQKMEFYRRTLELNRIKLDFNSPSLRIEKERQYLHGLEDRLNRSLENGLTLTKNHLNLIQEKLQVLSPIANLEKGFAYVETEAGIVKGISDVEEGERLYIQLRDGRISADIASIKKGSGTYYE